MVLFRARSPEMRQRSLSTGTLNRSDSGFSDVEEVPPPGGRSAGHSNRPSMDRSASADSAVALDADADTCIVMLRQPPACKDEYRTSSCEITNPHFHVVEGGQDHHGSPGLNRTPSVVISDHSSSMERDFVFYDGGTGNGEERDGGGGGPWRKVSDCSSCGSVVSLESAELQPPPSRKASSCSTCSSISLDDDLPPHDSHSPSTSAHRKPSGWRKVRNIVQLAPFFQTYRKQRYPWVQLAGHQGNFKAGEEQGTILKKLCGEEDVCLQQLRSDALRPYVPEYRGQILGDDCEQYLVLQDLLAGFTNPCVMDCKIGVRTYLEEELAKAKEKGKLRKDMYEKMCQIDPSAPSEEEHRAKGISKPRYMVWRETMSSTATLGFRIEGIKKSDGSSSQDFKMTKTKEKILEVFTFFLEGYPQAASKYLQRLRDISATLEVSEFFQSHELIGSSLLFVHDAQDAKIWLIDFAKTFPVPDGMKINHRDAWMVGNHEDGYLIGLESLIQVFTELFQAQAPHETQSTHR